MSRAFEIELSISSIYIDEKNLHRRVDGKAAYQVGASVLCNVRYPTSWAGLAHTLDILIHTRPKISPANAMVSTITVQMPSNGVSVEGNENDGGRWDKPALE